MRRSPSQDIGKTAFLIAGKPRSQDIPDMIIANFRRGSTDDLGKECRSNDRVNRDWITFLTAPRKRVFGAICLYYEIASGQAKRTNRDPAFTRDLHLTCDLAFGQT